ncbi:MAG: hypothetical protein K2Y22_00080 [Candidatus Obscuribacterales bacterium]|nr:hypothetical protein [Candidatus Obscuribacterales bacterium]
MKTCSPTYLPTSLRNLLLSNSLLITIGFASQVQAQVPLPGGFGEQNNSAQVQTQQVQQPKVTAPIPGNMPIQNPQSAYQQLPLNHLDAQARIESLKQTIATARPTKDLQESVYQLCEWLTDMANAHYKLSSVFAKHEATKAQAELERRQATKFSQLKNQAQLLKAELLIRQNRYPEALSPLVDIVSNEPRSVTGQQAYKRLQQIGFSEEVQLEEPKATASENAVQSAQNQNSNENKASATISRAGTVSVEGYVGSPNSATKPKTSVVNQPAKVPVPAPNQALPNQILSPR